MKVFMLLCSSFANVSLPEQPKHHVDASLSQLSWVHNTNNTTKIEILKSKSALK